MAHLEWRCVIARYVSKIIAAATTLACTGVIHAAPFLYIDDSLNNLLIVDTATGDATRIGNMGTSLPFTDIAQSPTGEFWGMTWTSMYRIDPATAVPTFVGNHGINQGHALEFSSTGTLFAAGLSNSLYTINTTTGSATALPGSMGTNAFGDLAFNNGQLYVTGINGQLVRLDNSGSTVTGTNLGAMGVSNVFGLTTDSTGRLLATAGNTIYLANTSTGALTPLTSYSGFGAAWGATAIPEVAPPPPPPPTEPNIYGVFVGRYDGLDGPFLHGLHGELTATDLRTTILDSFPNASAENLRLITNVPSTIVSPEIVLNAISEVTNKMSATDTFVLYIASHGSYAGLTDWNSFLNKPIEDYSAVPSGRQDEITTTKGDESILMSFGGQLWDDDLAATLKAASAGKDFQIWAFLDACFSGGFWGPETTSPGDLDLSDIPNIAFFASAPEGLPGKYWGLSGKTFFGGALVDAFSKDATGKLKADQNNDKAVSFEELSAYVDAWWLVFLASHASELTEPFVGYSDFDLGGLFTTLADSTFEPVAFSSTGFSGNLQYAQAPEPATLFLLLVAGAAIIVFTPRQRIRSLNSDRQDGD